MATSIRQRVYDSIAGSSSSELKVYEERIFTSWKDVSSSLSKSAALILALITLFELLAYQTSSHSFTISSLSFANTSTVQIFLPTVVAYIIYDGCRLTQRWMDLQTAYIAITERDAPVISGNDLDLLVAPILPAFWAIGKRTSAQNSDRGEKFIVPVSISLALITVVILPVTFEVQAYYHLFDKYGIHNMLLWANVVTTVLFVSCAAIYMMLRSD